MQNLLENLTHHWPAAGLAAVLLAGPALGQEASLAREASDARPSTAADGKPLALESVEAEGLSVRYRKIPCRPAASSDAAATVVPDSRRPWLLALLQLSSPLGVEGTRMQPGDYALICHPGDEVDQAPTVEIRRIRIPAALPDDPMVLGPFEGETLDRTPVRFDLAAGTTPHLTIQLTPGKGSLTLDVRSGDWAVVKEFRR